MFDMPIPKECRDCARSFVPRELIVTISVHDDRVIENGTAGPTEDSLFYTAFCQRCAARYDLTRANVYGLPGYAPSIDHDFPCFRCHRPIVLGESMISGQIEFVEYTGTYPIQTQAGQGLWYICMKCAPVLEFERVEIPELQFDKRYPTFDEFVQRQRAAHEQQRAYASDLKSRLDKLQDDMNDNPIYTDEELRRREEEFMAKIAPALRSLSESELIDLDYLRHQPWNDDPRAVQIGRLEREWLKQQDAIIDFETRSKGDDQGVLGEETYFRALYAVELHRILNDCRAD